MKTQALFVFVILLLGLMLCSFLGGNCGPEGFENKENKRVNNKKINNSKNNNTNVQTNYDNYNHFNGSSTSLQNNAIFTGENGGSITVKTASDGSQILEVTTAMDQTPITYTSAPATQSEQTSSVEGYTTVSGARGTATKFYGPTGETATVFIADNGQQAIRVTTNSGTYVYTSNGNSFYNPNVTNTQYYGSTGYQYPPYTASAYSGAGIGGPGYNPPGAAGPYNPVGYNPPGTAGTPGYNPPGAAGPYNPPGYNPPGVDKTYYDSLPPGIPASQIPPGQEDLYILKSQVVPPVCPACPPPATIAREEPCPACPPCARCPEPAFDCKKVPNYSAINNAYLPVPVLNDFSTFGM